MFRDYFDHDTITDFSDGEDVVSISVSFIKDFGDVMEGARQVGDDVVLALSELRQIRIENVRLQDLDRDDFLIV